MRVVIRRGDPDYKHEELAGMEHPHGYHIHDDADESGPFLRPIRKSYRHILCGAITRISDTVAKNYARNPKHYSGTVCVHCGSVYPVAGFWWQDEGGHDTTEAVGS